MIQLTHTFQRESVLEFKHMERLLMVMIGIEFLLVYQVLLSHIALIVSCTRPDGTSSFGTGWLFGPNDVATAAHVVYSQENGGYPSSIIFYPGVNNSGSIVGASYKATIAVLPATYQSERDETKDYAFLSLNYNYLLKYQI